MRTDPEPPQARGISVLVADITTPGITVRRFPALGGGSLCEVFLEGVEIPREHLVGELQRRAGRWLMHTLDFERVTSEKLGGVLWVLDRLEEHLGADERLALLRGELEAARLLSFPRRLAHRSWPARIDRIGHGEARRLRA